MRFFILLPAMVGPLLVYASGAERVTLTGKVIDTVGKPLENATVMIDRAGVKKGYSIFCPSCHVDCGKRTTTGPDGSFTINGVDGDLWFDVLVVRENYRPTYVTRVDPSKGPAQTAVLVERPAVTDPARVAKGRVVDARGNPQRAAIVTPRGVNGEVPGYEGMSSLYGTIEGLEPIAVTNSNGEFELSYDRKATGMMVQIETRGMAPKFAAVPTGTGRTQIIVSEGSVVRGRLVSQGKPVAGAQMGLIPRMRGGFGGNLLIVGDPYDEVRIGTQADGTFVIPNVPAAVDWYVYGEMESISSLGVTDAVAAATATGGQVVDVGDVEIRPGHRLRGKVVLPGGGSIGEGMRVTIAPDKIWDHQTVVIAKDGSFEFNSVPKGDYEMIVSIRGYALRGGETTMRVTVDKDIDAMVVPLEGALR